MRRSEETIQIGEQEFQLYTEIVELRLKHPFTLSRGTKEIVPNVLITVEANGFIGMGEAGPNARYGESAERVQQVIQKLAEENVRLWDGRFIPAVQDMSAKLGLPEQRSAALALEMAWLDWESKQVGQSLRDFLGIEAVETGPSSYTIGLDTPEKMAKKILDRPGALFLKIKLGMDPEEDKQIIRQIREASSVPIRVDANEGWTDLKTAMQMVEFLAEEGVELVEQPMPSSMDSFMPELRAMSPLPLIADESLSVTGSLNLDRLSERFHGINIKLMKIGSIRGSLSLLQAAQERGMSVMSGCMIESSLGIAAGALVGVQADYVDLDGHLLITNDPVKGLLTHTDGRITLSDKPGFGVIRVLD